METLKAWLAANGVWWDQEAICFAESPVESLGVRSLRRVACGAVLATVPKAAVLSVRNASLAPQLQGLPLETALRLAICGERLLGPSSRWHGYFESFKKPLLPYFWSSEQRRLLKGTDAEHTAARCLRFSFGVARWRRRWRCCAWSSRTTDTSCAR